MNLKLGRKYYLKTETCGKVSRYHMLVTGVHENEYLIDFTPQERAGDDRTFNLSYNKQTIDNCVEEGSWTIQMLKSPNIMDEELFTI